MLTEDQKRGMPKFLGIGSAFNSTLGNTSCYFYNNGLYNTDNTPELKLIDCGWDVYSKLVKNKLLEGGPDITIFITHTHGDHIGSLSTLIEHHFYINKKRCRLYYSEPEKIEKLLDAMLVPRGLYTISESKYHNKNRRGDETNYEMIHDLTTEEVIKSCAYKFNEYGPTYIFAWDTLTISPSIYKYFLDDINSEFNKNKSTYLFHDCCIANYPGNPHTYYKLLLDLVPKELRANVFPVHIDDDKVLDTMVAEGFGDVRELLI